MRRVGIAVLLVAGIGLSGCLISTQVGERAHVNSKAPDEITFHFDTGFNRAMLFGRSAALLLIPLWAFASIRVGGGHLLPMVLSAAAIAGAAWLLITGWPTVFDYRIEIRNDHVRLAIPSEPSQVIRWSELDSIHGEGTATDVTFGDGKGQALKWANEWEEMTLTLVDGRRRVVDLRPLSVEQRGTLWRAIARKAEFQVEEWVEPVKE